MSFSRRTRLHGISYGRVGRLLCSCRCLMVREYKAFSTAYTNKAPYTIPSFFEEYLSTAPCNRNFFFWKTLLFDSLVTLVPLTQLETIRPNLMFKDCYIYINLQPPYITAKILRSNLLDATILKIQFALRSNHLPSRL